MNRLLFICTGNYCRGRYAELRFNARAAEERLDWRAFSRGLAIDEGSRETEGPIAPSVLSELATKGVKVDPHVDLRQPRTTHVVDLARADAIIGLEESEHRPLLGRRFPGWETRANFWRLSASAAETLAAIDDAVEHLVHELKTTDPCGGPALA